MPLSIILGLFVFQALLIIVHLAVYATLTTAFGIGSIWFALLFVILAVTFVISSFLSHYYKGEVIDRFYAFSAYWFGLVHFLFGGAVAFYFALLIGDHYNIYLSLPLVGGITFGAAFFLHLYGTIKSQYPLVTKIEVKLSDTPGFRADFWKGKKIVFVSDFQLGNVYRKNFTARVARKIAKLDPYIVWIGGDLFDGVACDETALIQPLSTLHPEGGMFFITGNHEHYLPDVPRALAAIRALGIAILTNEKRDIGGIDLIGVDYLSAHKKEDFKKLLDGGIRVDQTKPNILLKHEPSDLDVAAAAGVSLTLSGHTHHGQIWPLSFFTWQIYKGYDYGLHNFGAMKVFTSSGVGTWGPPLRLGTRSEIVLIELV